jgi:hypothetical protein
MKVQLSLPSKVLLVLYLIVVLISTVWFALSPCGVTHLTLATGDLEGESYILSTTPALISLSSQPAVAMIT